MSSQNVELIPLRPNDLMGTPVQTMWKWHLINGLDCQMSDTLEGSYVHRRIAAYQFGKTNISRKSQDNRLFSHVRRLEHNPELMLYGDLLRSKPDKGGSIGEEAKTQ